MTYRTTMIFYVIVKSCDRRRLLRSLISPLCRWPKIPTARRRTAQRAKARWIDYFEASQRVLATVRPEFDASVLLQLQWSALKTKIKIFNKNIFIFFSFFFLFVIGVCSPPLSQSSFLPCSVFPFFFFKKYRRAPDFVSLAMRIDRAHADRVPCSRALPAQRPA
jgi:hypothetical protein